MKRAARHKTGSVVFDKRRKTWNYLWWENRKRRSKHIGTLKEFPNKSAAWNATQVGGPIVRVPQESNEFPTLETLVNHYRQEKMPERFSTSRGYESWIRNHILPKWASARIAELQARPVELWLDSLLLSPKSRSHVKGLVRILWDYAMWRGDVPTQRNPMELVTIKGASKRIRSPRSLTVEEFHKFVSCLAEPFRTIALVCVSFGLRISECLALKWSDVDWLNFKLAIRRSIVRHRIGDVKTSYSQRKMAIDAEMLQVLKAWKQRSQFASDNDWVFASPTMLGQQPWSYDHVWRLFLRAAKQTGIGRIGTHSMRHTYRSWLDAVGTTIAVQQKLMRHADIRTTMNIYGDVVTDEMAQAHRKVVGLALNQPNGLQADRKPS
jgi:integrase